MSGPSTRSHRSSVRAIATTLGELSDLLKANKSVVLIAGAGLSAASGKSCGIYKQSHPKVHGERLYQSKFDR